MTANYLLVKRPSEKQERKRTTNERLLLKFGADSATVGMIMFPSGGPSVVSETSFLGFSVLIISWVLVMRIPMWRGVRENRSEEDAPGEPRQ